MSRKPRFWWAPISIFDFSFFADFDGLHGYHHSNRLETLCLMETNRSKIDPLLTMKLEVFQILFLW